MKILAKIVGVGADHDRLGIDGQQVELAGGIANVFLGREERLNLLDRPGGDLRAETFYLRRIKKFQRGKGARRGKRAEEAEQGVADKSAPGHRSFDHGDHIGCQ